MKTTKRKTFKQTFTDEDISILLEAAKITLFSDAIEGIDLSREESTRIKDKLQKFLTS